MTPGADEHTPVMLAEVLEVLDPRPGDLLVDGTFGLGGHTLALLNHDPDTRALGIERDPWVLERARERLAGDLGRLGGRLDLVHGSFADVEDLLHARGGARLDAGLLDLGLNSLQIDQGNRGFHREDTELDLRFDPTDPMTPDSATALLATWPEARLADALHAFGGERLARPIARAFVWKRERGEAIDTASELARVVSGVYRRKGIARQRIHPVTRTVQALRIAVNRELETVARGLRAFLRALAPGGRFAVLTFHGGEAREVKAAFREAVRGEADWLEAGSVYEWIFRGSRKPGEDEIASNPRARSAQLRAVRRVQ